MVNVSTVWFVTAMLLLAASGSVIVANASPSLMFTVPGVPPIEVLLALPLGVMWGLGLLTAACVSQSRLAKIKQGERLAIRGEEKTRLLADDTRRQLETQQQKIETLEAALKAALNQPAVQ